jgi:multiple antibiotic resistance protein
MDHLKIFFLAFTPLFFALDSIGMLPIFISLTAEVQDNKSRFRLVRASVITAFIVALLFLFAGKIIFALFGITENDFRIGGGILLFVIAITDIVFSQQENRRVPLKEIAIVPIGMPLILGPASLTTILILAEKYGTSMTLLSIIINLIITFTIFVNSKWIIRALGKGLTMAIGKIFSLFLLAIAVMMIRIGITNSFIH